MFSSADLVATGSFNYDNNGPDDPEFSTYKLPASHSFADPTNRIRPFIEAHAGYFNLVEEVTALGRPKGQVQIQGITLNAGGGFEWQALDWLSFTPRLLGSFTHLWQDYDRDVPASDPTAHLIADWSAETFSLLPSLAADTHWRFGRWRLGANSTYTYISLHELSTSSDLVTLGSESHLWRNEASVRFDSPWRLLRLPVAFTSLFARHDIAGYLNRSGFVNHFYEARGGVTFSVPDTLRPVQEIGLTGAYYFGGPLSGYSIGLSLGF